VKNAYRVTEAPLEWGDVEKVGCCGKKSRGKEATGVKERLGTKGRIQTQKKRLGEGKGRSERNRTKKELEKGGEGGPVEIAIILYTIGDRF